MFKKYKFIQFLFTSVLILVGLSLEVFADETPVDTILISTKSKSGANLKIDSKRIQQAIDKASSNRGVYIKLNESGVFELTEPLTFKDNVEFDGNGSVLVPSLNWTSFNEDDSPVFNIINVENIKISNLTFDFKGEQRTGKERVYCGIFILGSKLITIQNVTFKNGGIQANNSNQIPNSPYVLIVSQDYAEDSNSVPSLFRSEIGASMNILIDNCNFLNLDSKTRFGVRLLTNWSKKRDLSEFVNKTQSNIISNCVFIGEFSWNTIELAGGGTIENLIYNNLVSGNAVNNIDIDKGASYNIIKDNTVNNAGLPEVYKNDPNARYSAIIVQGWTGARYFSKNNLVEGNCIENLSNPISNISKYAYSAAISGLAVSGLKIENNFISTAFQDSSYRNGKPYGGGIVLDHICNDVIISGNEIHNVNYGVVFTMNGKSFENIDVLNNVIYSKNISVFFPTRGNGPYKNLNIFSNKLFNTNNKNSKSIHIGNVKNSIIKGNFEIE